MQLPHFLLLMIVNLAWGFNFVATRFTVMDLPPVWAAALRFAIVAVLLAPFLKVPRHKLPAILRIALILGILHFGGYYVAIAMSSNVSIIAVGMLTIVPFSTLMAVLLLKETIGWKRGLGIMATFSGVFMIAFDKHAFQSLDGLLIVIISAFGYALASVYMRRLEGVSVFTLQGWVSLIGAAVLMLVSFAVEQDQIAATLTMGDAALGGLFYSAIIASLVGHGGVYFLLQRYEVSLISPLMLLAQVFGVMFSVLVLGESLTMTIIVGAGLTFMGSLWISLRNRQGHAAITKEAV